MKKLEKSVSKGATKLLNDLWWHDSVLYGVHLLRVNWPDEVAIEINLVLDWDNLVYQRVRLTFSDCYLVDMHLNWGYVYIPDGEAIAYANATIGGPLVDRVKDKLKEVPQLAEFHLLLNSTNSEIDIVFGKVKIQTIGSPTRPEIPTKTQY